ncbi:MAG: large subunit ribosomal protein L31 [Rickettsiales bacterium]|jgi:large subunit ribosomal protein L31
MTKSSKRAKTEVAATSTSKHPVQHKINLLLSNKETIEIITTWGKEGETLTADIDPFNHPAWQDGSKNYVNPNNDNMNKFIKKFAGFGEV